MLRIYISQHLPLLFVICPDKIFQFFFHRGKLSNAFVTLFENCSFFFSFDWPRSRDAPPLNSIYSPPRIPRICTIFTIFSTINSHQFYERTPEESSSNLLLSSPSPFEPPSSLHNFKAKFILRLVS